MKRRILNTIFLLAGISIFSFALPRINTEAQQTCCPECGPCRDEDGNEIPCEDPLPWCGYPASPCEDDPTPSCESHDCDLPTCPDQTTSEDTGYLLDNLLSCDKGCDETKYGDCYEEIPGPVPCIDGDCTSVDIQFVLGTNQKNDLNCESSVASGKEVNNPVSVRATYSHSVSVDDLETIYFYMVKDGDAPLDIQWVDEDQGDYGKSLSNESFGFMVRKVDGVWSALYLPYVSDKGYWKYMGNISNGFTIDGPNGLPMVKVHNFSITSASSVVANFDIEFLYEDSGVENYEKVIEETYDVFGMANDEFGFTPYDNYTDPQILNKLPYEANEIRFYDHWKNTGEWIVDLTNPVVESLQEVVIGSTEINIDWLVADSQSSIKYVVGNGYRPSYGVVANVPVVYNGSNYTLTQRGDTVSGNLNPLAYEDDSYLWGVAGVSSRSETVDLGINRGGSFDFDVTAFDVACNAMTRTSTFKLGEWIESKGGFVFSRGGTNIDVRLLNAEVWKSTQWPTKYGLEEEYVDLSTELLAAGVSDLSSLKELQHEASNGAYRALGYNGLYRSDIYAHYLEKYTEISLASVKEIDSGGTLRGSLSSYCTVDEDCTGKIYVENIVGDLSVEEDFLCDGKAVFLVGGELTINPDIENSDNISACIFIVKGDVHIKEGENHSEESIGFDIIESYIVTRGIIYIEKEDKTLTETKDGIFVEGGLVAFGEDPTTNTSIVLERELSLEDRHVFPVLNVIRQPKYGKLIKQLFGGENFVFKTEIGLKPV